jgi:phytol kinase
MGAPAQIALAFGSVCVLLGLMAAVKHVAGSFAFSAELQRKLVHIGTGLYALTLPWLFPDRWPVYMLVGFTLVVMLVLRLPRFASGGIGSTLHSVDRHSYGDMLLAVAVGLCLFLAEDQMVLYVLPIAVLTLADAAAALAGTTYGRRFFRVEDGQKSLEGCVVFFTVTLLLAMVCLMAMTSYPPLNIILLSLMVAGFGTLVEAVSWRGFDNLFLPLGILVFLASHGDREIGELLFLAGLFAATLIGFRAIAPLVGLTNHAGRVYVTTVFLLLAVTSLHNAFLPISVFLSHAWSRSVNPDDSNYPDLDIVAGVVFLSLFWLTLGNATGWNAVSFYGISAMGLSVGFCGLALATKPILTRIFGLLCVILVLCALRYISLTMNDDLRNWNGPMWGAVMVNLIFFSAITFDSAFLFKRFRVIVLTVGSTLVPIVVYCVKTNFGGLL